MEGKKWKLGGRDGREGYQDVREGRVGREVGRKRGKISVCLLIYSLLHDLFILRYIDSNIHVV